MKQTIEVLIYVNGECVLEEKLSEHHDELLDDSLFGEEYKSLSENDQLGWCLENIEDVVKGQMERMKKYGIYGFHGNTTLPLNNMSIVL